MQTSALNSLFQPGNINHNHVGRDQYNIEYRNPIATRDPKVCDAVELTAIGSDLNDAGDTTI
jgi:hypothetical protein